MDVNELERLSDVGYSLKFIYIYILSYYKLFLYFNLCLRVMSNSLLSSFTSISFLTTSCSFTLICGKGTACSKKRYGCKWTWETIRHYSFTQINVHELLVVRKDILRVMSNSLLSSFTSISFLTTSCSFTLICV
jgi:hypothetical protein